MRSAILAGLSALLMLGPPAVAAPNAKARLEGLDALRTQYVLKSASFSPADREQAMAMVEGLERRADNLPDVDLLVGVLRVIASAHNGHDSLGGKEAAAPPARLPVHMIWFADGLFIARAGPQYVDLLGAKVTAIDGVAPEPLLKRLNEASGGIPDSVRQDAT